MNAFYIQQANTITPIFGTASIEEAAEFAGGAPVVHTDEAVYMNPNTGSVGFESDWEDMVGLIEVRYCAEQESWVEA